MNIFSKLIMMLFLMSFGCANENETGGDVGLPDASSEVAVNDFGADKDRSNADPFSFSDCSGLIKVDCLSRPEHCDWYAMRDVAFENNVCVLGGHTQVCAPNQGDGIMEIFINIETQQAVISPIGFGPSWPGWESCDEQELCDCSSCPDRAGICEL